MDSLWQDVRYALRQLTKRPVFTGAVVFTLALGIGANTAIFSVVESVLLTPLPYPDADRLVVVWERNFPRQRDQNVASSANYWAWRDRSTPFERLVPIGGIGGITLSDAGGPERVRAARVGPEFFDLLHVPLAHGRPLRREDGAGGPDAIVISHGLWQRRFGGDPELIGQRVTLDGRPRTVVGITDASFRAPELASLDETEVWVPLVLGDDSRTATGRWLLVLGSLVPGRTLASAQTEMSAIAAELASTHEYDRGWGVNIVPLDEQIVGDARTVILIVFAAVSLVLLLVCVNVANLLVVHFSTRRRELAVRTAMGAHAIRLVRQLVTEGLVLATLGGLAGVLVAVQALDALVALAPAELPGLDRAGIDGSTLAYAATLALVAAAAVSLVPALGLLRRGTADDLRDAGTRTTDRRGQRVRGGLVSAQVALALVLAVSAGLLAKSFARLRSVEPGFDASGVLAARVSVPTNAYPDDGARARFYGDVVGRLAAIPGIRAAGATARLPFDGLWIGTSFRVMDRPEPPPEDRPVADIRTVTPGYYATMRIPLLEGRDFSAVDRADAPRALIINQTMAQSFWPDGSALGQEVSVNLGDSPYRGRVVGVVGDVKHQGLDYVPRAMIYLAHDQFPWNSMHVVARTDGDPAQLAGTLRRVIGEVDPALPVYDITTVDALVHRSLAADRFATTLIGAFAVLALTLAAVGIYGVIAYSVAQRTSELGIRIALGAARKRVLQLVLRQGIALVGWGTAIGLVGSVLATRSLSTLLFGVSPRDLSVFALTAAVLAAVSIAACLIPARRAASIDPVEALRQE